MANVTLAIDQFCETFSKPPVVVIVPQSELDQYVATVPVFRLELRADPCLEGYEDYFMIGCRQEFLARQRREWEETLKCHLNWFLPS